MNIIKLSRNSITSKSKSLKHRLLIDFNTKEIQIFFPFLKEKNSYLSNKFLDQEKQMALQNSLNEGEKLFEVIKQNLKYSRKIL